jgi:CBS domain containing-hemolysin-like protein
VNEKKNVKKKKEKPNSLKWPITVAFIAFAVSFVFSYLSNTAISKLNLILGIIVLLLVIIIGIVFDLIGVSVTIAKEEEFHAMASKKIKGAKTAIKLIRNSAKVSNICADVVGDICGVISGAIGTMIAIKIMESAGVGSYIQFIMSALIASITISGKALTKEFAKKNATKVLSVLIKIIPFSK